MTESDDKAQAQDVIETAVRNQPRCGCLRGCLRGCLVYGAISFLVVALPVWWFCIHTTPLRISKETTYALGPLHSDGKRIDYFRAMEERYYPPEMKTDENGYRLIVRACGDVAERTKHVVDPKTREIKSEKFDPEPLRVQVYEKLGLDPDLAPTVKKIQSPYGRDYIYRYDKEHPPAEGEKTLSDRFSGSGTGMWTFEDFPMLREWLDENTAGIDLIGEAVRKPVFRIPFTRENENVPIFQAVLPLAEVQMVREWARAVQARAAYRVGTGDIDGAIDDVVTLHRLARHVGRNGMLVSWLVGIAIDGMAFSVGIAENPEHPPTKEQIERLVRELDALPPHTTLEEAIEFERYFGLAAIQDMYWGNVSGFPDGTFPEGMEAAMRWTVDINIFMERANKIYDALIRKIGVDGQPLEEILDKSWNPLLYPTVRGRSTAMMDSLASLLIPSLQAAREALRRIECTENIQRLTLALLLYAKDHDGTMPPEDAVPEGDWREAILPYLGPDPDKVMQCPTYGLKPGETTYAMIGGVDNPSPTPWQVLIVEVLQPQELGKGDGRYPLEKAMFWRKDPAQPNVYRPQNFDGLGSRHAGGCMAGFRSGAARFLSETIEPEKLEALLDGTATSGP